MTAVTVPATAIFSAKARSRADQSRGCATRWRELVVALFVAAGNRDGKVAAGLDAFGIVREGRARQNAFNLVTDVEDNLIDSERDDRALKLLGFGAMGVRALEGL